MKKPINMGWTFLATLKFDLKMRLTTFLFIVSLFQIQANNSYSQNTKITINMIDASIEDVINKIESLSKFKFFINTVEVDLKRKVSVNERKTRIFKILSQLFKGTNISYEVFKKQIVLKKQIINTSPVIDLNSKTIEVIQQQITGAITDDDGVPLPGASILEKGTSNGTQTDFDGNYSLEVNSGATLVISYLGYTTQEIVVGSQSIINIQMVPDAADLDEIVVVAYGSVKKSDMTGSVSSVKSEEILKTSSTRLDDALRGKVAGVQITPTSSQPGAASFIRIRGTNSISGNSSPLFVIDGLIGTGNTSDLNLQDVESVEILKDASATALYGSRGSAGVVLITTKRGRKGKAKLSYDTFASFTSPTRFLPMLNAAEFGDFQNEVQGVNAYPNPESLGEGTNWQDEVYRESALTTSHTLSISGGSENANYYVSGSYLDQDGIYFEGNLKRYQLRMNGDFKIGKILKIGNSVSLTRNKTIPGGSSIINIAGYFPTLPVFDENGAYTIQTESSELSAENPIGGPAKTTNLNTRSRMYGTVYAELEPIKNLKYKLSYGIDLSLGKSENYSPSTLFNQINTGGTATISNSEYLSSLIEHTLTYKREIGEHYVDGLIGYTRQTTNTSNSSVGARGFTTDFFTFNNIDAGTDRFQATSGAAMSGVESLLFRVNYNYKSKYLLTINGRRDGSSDFAEGQKYGFFPSAALAWTASKEKFIDDLGVFSSLKFRASLGRLGNPASGGTSLARLGAGFTYLFGNSGDISNGIGLNRLGNDQLRFETTNQLDVGIDAGFFNNRLSFTLDYYKKKTKDLFTSEQILWLSGVPNSSVPTNFGVVENQGFEILINSVNIDTKDFTWETSFNLTTNKNKVISIPDEDGELRINTFGGVLNQPSALIKVGEPLGVFFGYKRNGIWNTQEEIDAAGLTGRGVFPGGKRFEDISGPDGIPDGIINGDDQTIIGNPHPKVFGGFNNTFRYKNFDFSMYWSYVLGNDIFNETDSRINTAFDNNVSKIYANRWTPTNTDSNVPSVRGIFRTEAVPETNVVEDGSFLRLRNISIGYNLQSEKLPFQKARIYLSGTNLLLFDNYSGYDPEVNRNQSNTRRGYDLSQDPSVSSLVLGLNLTF